jgi:polyisoprenoid-binding protein YceI
MQVHFNEKYLESEKFPKSTFVGTLKGFDITKEGVQNVTASGRLSIHGVNKEMSMPGTLEVKGRNIVMKSKFKVKLADFNITIPQVVWQNISEEVEISVNFTYSPL